MEILTTEDDGSKCFIKYIPRFLDSDYIYKITQGLKNNIYIGGETDYGNKIPRVQRWMHNDDVPFSELWKQQFSRWQPQKYIPPIKELQDNLIEMYHTRYLFPEFVTIPEINSALVNKYRSGNDSISFHRDNLPEFGENPTIMIASFGETRTIQFRRVKYNRENPKSMKLDKDKQDQNFNIELEEGSLLIMGGATQKYYSHGIDKHLTNNERYSITFREHHSVFR
jgi:alkylated DNA repair dioxygenase AlkB